MKDRTKKERNYWDKAALDPNVDKKYICDFEDHEFKKIVGNLIGRVLDLGCGVGRLMHQGFYGIDISPKMIEIAERRKPECCFALCDGRSIPFPCQYFDNMYSILLFQHLPASGINSYIKEASRVLKKDGTFVIQFIEGSEDEPFSKHYRFSSIKIMLEFNHFVIKNIKKGLIHEQWTWVFAKKL